MKMKIHPFFKIWQFPEVEFVAVLILEHNKIIPEITTKHLPKQQKALLLGFIKFPIILGILVISNMQFRKKVKYVIWGYLLLPMTEYFATAQHSHWEQVEKQHQQHFCAQIGQFQMHQGLKGHESFKKGILLNVSSMSPFTP